jgi:geranylgeranyl pyrophosphate synthase
MQRLTDYGNAFGLLFQATDDLLDVVGTAEEMGKTLGKDAASGKLTCISAYGIECTRELVRKLHKTAVDAMSGFGESAGFFIELVDSMVERTH